MFKYAADCIILESDGRFGIVDCGDDAYYPDGTDTRYPWRASISQEARDNTSQVLSYLNSVGATPANVEFLVGTHPHSDHIGGAPQVIDRYKPARVYTPEYEDGYITSPSQLWDNLFIYDRFLAAAQGAGSSIIQRFDPAAPLVPESGSVLGCSEFDLGSMHITLLNTDESYKETGVYGANAFSLGVLVEANGQRAFLAGDINNIPESSGGKSSEDNLAPIIGKVDVLKLGHHGNPNSNTPDYLRTLAPSIAVQTGSSTRLVEETKNVLKQLDAKYYCADLARARGVYEIVVELASSGAYVSNTTPMPYA
jgi:beta-lactamase superfamily II metal-dependent hydrolase